MNTPVQVPSYNGDNYTVRRTWVRGDKSKNKSISRVRTKISA